MAERSAGGLEGGQNARPKFLPDFFIEVSVSFMSGPDEKFHEKKEKIFKVFFYLFFLNFAFVSLCFFFSLSSKYTQASSKSFRINR